MNKEHDNAAKHWLDSLHNLLLPLTDSELLKAVCGKIENILNTIPAYSEDTPYHTFASASAAIRAGRISEFKVGDIIHSTHAEYGNLEWRIIGINAEMGSEDRPCITVQLTKAVTWRWFSEPSKKYRWGCNSWVKSDLRKWLNDDFLDGFSYEDQKGIIESHKRIYEFGQDANDQHSTVDYMFLLSQSEFGFEVDNNSIFYEGEVYEYYKNAPDIAEARQFKDMDGDDAICWMRSPNPWYANYVRLITTDGSLSNDSAHGSFAVVPACAIG